MQVQFLRYEQLSTAVWTLYFKPISPVQYEAGQFIEITLPHDPVDTRGQRRWFTLSSSPTEQELAITTKHDQPASSFKSALFNIKPGTILTMSAPMGDFVLPRQTDIPILFVAGGIGITPVRSIVKSIIDQSISRPIDIIYAAATRDDMVFQDVIRHGLPNATMILEEAANDWDGQHGTLAVDLIKQRVAPHDHHLIYISGPEPMVESFTDDLLASGYREHRLVRDYFPGYPFTN